MRECQNCEVFFGINSEVSTISIMEKQPVVFGNEDGGTKSNAAPAFYVLVKQPQTTGKTDQGTLVSNQDDCGLNSSAVLPIRSKAKDCLPADCTSGGTTVILDNNNMWNEFYHRSTEMILTKQGRRMFPYCRYWITGLESNLKYILIMDISPVDNFRYKWNGHSWEPNGKAEPHVLGRVFIHPESPSTGRYWMHQPVSFYKLKLTNNTLDQEGHIILHSMHRYLPRLHLVPADKATEVIQLNGPDVHTFTFPQTEFFAVTAYQNIQITQLKIDYNPFAKGFRDDGMSSKPQRDVKQNGNSEQEGGSATGSPSNHKHPPEADTLDAEQRDLEPPFNGIHNRDLEKESFSPDHDFLGFIEADMHVCDSPVLKQEASENPVTSPYQSRSQVASPLNSNEDTSGGIKEEPIDDYDYGPSVCGEDINVKPEEADKEMKEHSDSDDSIPEKQLKKHSEMRRNEVELESHKRSRSSQLGVAKAKMLKLDSGKMPVVYLEPCAVTRNTVKICALAQTILSSSKNEKSHLSHSRDSSPTCSEKNSISSPFTAMEMEEIPSEKQLPGSNVPQRCSSFRDVLLKKTEPYSSLTVTKKEGSYCFKPTACYNQSLPKDISGGGKSALKNHVSHEHVPDHRKVLLPGPRKRGRPRKIKFSEVGQPPKYTGKSTSATNYASLGLDTTHLDVKPDLEDVDGVLFVSFASKEALDIHTVDGAEEKEELPNIQIPLQAACVQHIDPDVQRIEQREKELLEDLKSFKYKQVIHPSLQEVGLKLNFVDPTMSIDLKYLGVQLPLSYSNDYTLWKTSGANSNSIDSGLPFISRTGKTNDFTKIKGWRGKFNTSSKNEGSILEGSLKNRSAFCSDKLDEYLENEGKLMETSLGFSPSTSSCPVIYQLPTKSTSYVRTLDSVLKKQSTSTPSSSYTFKPLSVPSVSRKKRKKIKNKKQAVSRVKGKPPHKSAIPLPVVTKQKCSLLVLEEKVIKNQPSSQTANEVDTLVVPGIEENVQGKQISVRQAQQQSSRPPSLSKTQLKLMDLEDCALWEGKPRTYITEERAELSLTSLLTAQASLKNKPIHKIIKRRAPPCNNDFCRLGCICSSLALENRQSTHCRKPDCMFGCTCLKRRVVLVKGGSKHKRILEKPLPGRHRLYSRKEQERLEEEIEKGEEQEKLKDKKRRKKVEYKPEKPVKNFPLWVKVDGEMDPEPVYIPTPSPVEPTKSVVPPVPEVLPSDKPVTSGVKPASSGVKQNRVYTPRPNPVIREEDKDPVYLYFESMMTCARVRIYERKMREKKQSGKSPRNSERSIEKEHDPEPQPLKMEEDKEFEKSCWFSYSAEDPSTSYMHHTTPGGTTKLIEIVSDCNWEEDRNEILNILSQHIKNKMPKSLKVGHFVIDLESESKTWDEKNTPIYSSRVKISMPSLQNKGEKTCISVSEAPNNKISACKRMEKITFLTPGMLREQRKKGLPFYAGVSPAGKLSVYTGKSNLNPSCLIQVNGKNYPQAKLLLGQMGALHPANRLAAYITGRLRPTVLDLSVLSTVISKVASNAKLAGSEPQSTKASTKKISKTPFSNSTTSTSTSTAPKVHAPAQRRIAARPLADGVPSQLGMSTVLQQKITKAETPQSWTEPQAINIKSTPLSPGTTTVTTSTTTVTTNTTDASITVEQPAVTAASPAGCNKAVYSSGIAIANAVGKLENSTVSTTTTTATVTVTKSTGIPMPVANLAFAKSIIAASAVTLPVSTTTRSTVVTTTASVAGVTAPTVSICTGPSGIQKSPSSNQKPGATSPPGLSPRAEKRMGPRLLLIPVPQGSPALRPQQNLQLAPGKKVILQPLRNPGGVNLYRHPNGQIIQLVPLQQLQPAGPQPSLPPIVLRNPGSVVGIGLPGPSKLPETTICQSTSVSSPIPTTTVTSALPGSPSTLSTPATTETSSGLSTCSSALSTPPTTESPSMLPVPRITDTLSTSPLYPTTEATSTLLSSPTTKGLSTSPLPSAINQTIRSVLTPPISTAQATPTVSPVPVAVSQGGVLTLRISPSGVRNIATHTSSDSKTTCSTIGQPNSTPSLISLQSGSFALLQVPGQKNIPNSIVKQVSSLENTNQKNELSAIKLQEENSCLREVAALPLAVTMSDNKTKENVLPANQPESRSEITYDRNATTSETTEENAETLDHLSSRTPIFQSDVVSSDHSYISEKEKCAKHPESIPAEVPYTTETVHEGCSQIAVLAQDALQERKVAMPLKSSGEEQAYSVQTQSPAADLEEAEQMKFATEEGGVVEQSQKQWDKEEVHINCTEKLQEKVKSSQWENQDLEQLERNRKGKDDSVAAERDQQVVRGNPKVNNAKNENNTLGNKYVDGTQEFLHERNNHSQENYDVSSLKEGTTGIQEDNQTVKGSLVQVSQTWNKISKQSVFSENKSSMGTAEHVEKFAKCIEQDILKSNNLIKDPVPIIDITMDDKEKDEKTDDSADDMVDEVSGCQSEDIVNVETLNGSESSEVEENVDIETVEELSEKINIARLKATAAHALLSKQLHLVRDHSSKAMTKTKQSEPSNKKPKDEEEAFANYRQTHTANERRRRKEMRGLFEKLKAALGLHSLPKVSKCFILKQAFEEIQGLTDQADKLTGQKNLLMRKQDTLIRKVSALSGKTQEVVLKKLEYIYAKQKAVEAQKKQQQAEPMKIIETAETARPPVESSPSLFESSLMKPAVMSNQRTKPLILSRKGSRATGEPPSPVAVTNASLVMTAQGQVLAFKSPLMPGQVAALPSTLLQAELKSEVDSSSGITQPGIASVMIQLPGSTVPMQMKGIIPNSTIPIALSPVASSRASPAAESASELTSETEDTFMMPRIVNVTSLATEEDRSLNLDVSRDSYTASHANSQISEPSMQAALKETTDSQSEEKAKTTCGKGRDANRTAQDFFGRNSFPQIVNVSSLKGSPESFATKLCIEELAGGQTEEKQVSKGGDRQKAKDFSFQKLQAKEPKDSGIEMELTKVASAMHEAELDESELMDIEESDDTDETLTSLLNEIAFLNQQLNDDASDIPELPNSLSSGFSLGGMECHRKSATANRSPFPFGALSGSFKDLSVVQESGDSISPLLLHLDDDDLPDGNRNLRELSSESDTLKIMQSSEVKDSNPDYSALNSDGSGENKEALAKTRSMSPPVLQMKTNVETGNTDTTWRPMPKLAPLGLKTANLPLEPEGQNTKAMPLLAPVAAKEIPVQPVISPNQDTKAMPTLVPVVTKSK